MNDTTPTVHPQLERCPICKSQDLQRGHVAANTLTPECTFWRCEDCLHEWGHA